MTESNTAIHVRCLVVQHRHVVQPEQHCLDGIADFGIRATLII